MKLDPPEIYGWRIFLIASTVRIPTSAWLGLEPVANRILPQACLGGMIFGMDTGSA
jgi:hypothetical protein